MKRLPTPKSLDAFVNEIFLIEDSTAGIETRIPIYADGFPGVMYSQTQTPVIQLPKSKKLSSFFLYGQTIESIELLFEGAHKAIVLQLYPFASRLLLGINPKVLNDDCYDLRQIEKPDVRPTLAQLEASTETEKQIAIIGDYIKALIKHSSTNPDHTIKLATNLILKNKGNITVKEVRDQLYISERTFERRFAREVGITPKQFAKIIQFNFSKNQLSEKHYLSLTEISYETGFSDQSHFIKTFKHFVGMTPGEYYRQMVN